MPHAISQEQYSIWSCFLLHYCKMMISPGGFFIFFFFILIFQAVREVKRQKIVQDYKKFCLLHCTSQESYIIWLSFVVHLCEIMIFPGIFSFFKILIFCVVRGVKGEKMVQNEKKIMSVVVHTSKNIHHMIFIYGTQG